MNRRSILTKTGKGLMEATGKTSNLSRDLRNLLKDIDGKVSVSELLGLGRMAEPKLLEALGYLEREGYLREFVGRQDEAPRSPAGRAPTSGAPSESGEDLDFTAFTPAKPSSSSGEDTRLQAQAQEIARQAQITRAKEEAVAKARAVAAARARAEAEQKARVPPEVKAKAEVQARAQTEALDRARRDADERQRRETEEKTRREAEARARIEAELAVKREAEDGVRREAQDLTRRESEEKARREEEARARWEAEEKVRREVEERARREIEDRTRREMEERLRREEAERRRREEEERVRREAEELERRRREEHAQAERAVRIEIEARAKVEAETHARRESQERARRDEEERPRREEELRRRTDEETRRRQEAEELEGLERSLREQEEKVQREAEEREREERERAEEEGRTLRESGEDEELAREEAKREKEEAKREKEEAKREKEEAKRAREEEKARARAEAKSAAKLRKAERSGVRAEEEAWRGDDVAQDSGDAALSAGEVWAKRKPRSLIKQFALMLLILLIVAIAAIPFVPLETAEYEKAAQAWLGEPVKIGSVTVSLVPMPQLKFEKIAIGRESKMRVASIRATPEIGSLLAERKALKKLELENVTFPREYLGALLARGKGQSLGVERIAVKGLKIDIPELNLPTFDLEAIFNPDGRPTSVTLSSAERRLSVKLQPQGERASVEISSDGFPLPIGADFPVSDFQAKGTVTRNELALTAVEGRAFGGRLFGKARLRWSGGWSLDGEFEARQMEAARIAAPLVGTGTLDGKAAYSMKGLLPDRLLLNTQLEGTFTIQRGSITNVDMTRLLQGSSSGGGTTLFSEMSGGVSVDPNRLLVRQIRMAAGLLNGTGQVEMDPQKNLSGRMQIELRAQTVQGRATLAITGTLKDPQFRRSN